jgi:hypothetical protein
LGKMRKFGQRGRKMNIRYVEGIWSRSPEWWRDESWVLYSYTHLRSNMELLVI